ncbi:helix-turn-helix domain-containing protein [Sporosarcina soli]|uniref:Helix-turn-helix domain-containing protein n=1 Tax=Sporosarcina soli TaxID=334736 RepID=A0ABW0TF99_9BACL
MPSVFAKRLKKLLDTDDVEIQKAANYCGVTTDYITKLMTNPTSLPGVRTLYKLAELFNVTPDYLGGFTSDPNGHDSRTPRPRDMQDFLAKEEVMLYGEVLDDEDKEKLNSILAAVFFDAKKKNKRK